MKTVEEMLRVQFQQANQAKASGRFEEAISIYKNLLEQESRLAPVYNNLANCYYALGQYAETIENLNKALEIDPDFPEAHYNLACQFLLWGEFELGWEELEWRWKTDAYSQHVRQFTQPNWEGESFVGKTLLLHSEQGFGDSIQFVRYAKLAKVRGGKVILACQPELIRLFKNIDGVDEVVPRTPPFPEHDLQISLMSLPKVFKIDLKNIFNPHSYLKADPKLSEIWKQEIGNEKKKKVGIAWKGNPLHARDSARSIALRQFATIFKNPNLAFFSFQKAAELDELSLFPELIDLGNHFHDFADTAAAMDQMDCFICVDTSVAHLGGALGKPTWLLLPFSPDWRWMMEREQSPWYPGMQLFRQTQQNDWNSVFQRLERALKLLAL